PLSEAPSAASLLAMRGADFYGKSNSDPMTSEGEDAARTMATHYQGAWGLVHLLIEHPSYKQLFVDYLDHLRRGDSNPVAWSKTLAGIPAEKLEADYRVSLHPKEVVLLRTPYAAPAYASEGLRAMPDREVHLLWARLRDWSSPEGHRAAEADIQAARSNPDDPDFVLVNSLFEAYGDGMAEAKQDVRQALTKHPNDPRLWNALGWLEIRGVSKSKAAPVTIAKELAEVERGLAPIAESSNELHLLAYAAGFNDRLDAALAYEKRALRA